MYEIPTQSCVLAHVTTQMEALRRGAPVDLVFQSIAGTEAANASFGVNLALLDEACQAARELAARGENVMYFETGQGSALSANAHHGVDQQTCEARAYAVARQLPSAAGEHGGGLHRPGVPVRRQADHPRRAWRITSAASCWDCPMGCDVCYTNHAEADQDDMDVLLTLLGAAGVNYIMGVPGADDVMLHYQSTSFHDALYLRAVAGAAARAGVRGVAARRSPGVAVHDGPTRTDETTTGFQQREWVLRERGSSVTTKEVLAFQTAHAGCT